MLRNTYRRLGGGGELFPTSKETAHLAQQWVMERRPPPPPGRGMCHVPVVNSHSTQSKWQTVQAHIHSVVTIPLDAASPPNAVTPRPSTRAVDTIVAGVKSQLSGHARGPLNSIAAANISAKAMSEARMKTRDYGENKSSFRERPGWEVTTDVIELSEWLYKRIHKHRKMVNDNSNGYEKEYMPWEKKQVIPSKK
ncbi:hypothetical protein ERJ75_000940800 [Trypanosoma vivax]|uniref:Uncharacterized protein n=1 Tax=Trypanosoma vivax (strain Y486) TaxID=1055687 RepID=G0U4D9_TRYVY|nr:hypothetical protein TRVL_03828 [Trypanosoma vivax]KAH8611591.1 hypothetical protein ERJ75_000940800 [Trypanosoma vivax]CCC52303.1 conserved hypothetical protein, fragment [Trypanosoma vivax Y486]